MHFITFNGLSFQGSNENVFLVSGGQHVVIINCDIDYSGSNAIYTMHSTYLNVENNTINYTNNNAIEVYSSSNHSSILNNVIKNTGIIPGMTKNSDGVGNGIFINYSDNSLVQYNEVDSTGYSAIVFMGSDISILNNFVNYSCLIKGDGGGIYTYMGEKGTTHIGRQIIGNIILNSIGNREGVTGKKTQAQGIYLDGYSTDVDIMDNTVANCSDYGIFIHGSKNIKIKDNTLFNNEAQLYFYNWGPGITEIDAKRNIYFSKNYSQLAWGFYTAANDIANFGVSDSNYFARPFDDKLLIHTINYAVDDYLGKPYNLAAWQKSYNQDLHSTNSINLDYQYIYTALESNKYANEKFFSNVSGLGYSNCTRPG